MSFQRFSAVLYFLVVGFAACLMPAQNDTWWHLRAGKEILESGRVPLRDSFSHTVNGGYWPDHEWLSQVVFYGLYRIGGLPLLTGFNAVVVTSTWVIAWRLAPWTSTMHLAVSAIGVMLFAQQWSLRPQIFTLLFLVLTPWFIMRRRYIWFLPLMFAVWANLHGGVMLGMILLTGTAVLEMVLQRRPLVRPVALTAACALATGLTPLGFSVWAEVPAALSRSRSYGIAEWKAPTLTDPLLAPFWLLGTLLLWLLITTKPWRRAPHRRDVPVWGALALLPLALSASRNVSPFAVLVVPAVNRLLQSRFPSPGRAVGERPRLNSLILALTAVFGVGGVGYAWSTEIPRLQWQPLPRELTAAISACPEQVYNRYDEGGYLIWFAPSRKVFIDSRQDPYPPELMQEHMRVEASGEYEPTFSRYSIRCAFLPAQSLLAQRLMSERWTDLYRDDNWVVLARP
jgi:hypothetical protein